VGAHRPKGVDHARRQILAWGAAMAGVAIAPGITLFDLAHGRPPSEPASRAKRWGMLVDVSRCAADCNACVVACDKENGLPIAKTATSAQWIRKVDLKDARGATKSPPNRPASTSARPGPRSSAPTASCWSIATRASAAATA
jgi:molybdopterin-containing oxidoreductase family iron-sulfur binding subunit